MQTPTQAGAPLRAQRRLLLYVVIAFGVSWLIEIPLALRSQGLLNLDVPFSLHYLAAFGPMVAALIATGRESGRAGLKDLVARMTLWTVAPVWWIVALSPLLMFCLVAGVRWMVQGETPDFSILGRVDFLPDLGLWAIPMWLATFGWGEETGWRGYLLPRLQQERSAWNASVFLWIIWAIWHIPSFFYLHTVSGVGTLIGFLLGVFAGTILLTWLYNSTGGSVLIVAVWHGLFDYVTACTECKSGLIAAILSTVVMISAAAIIPVFKLEHLSRRERHTL